MNLRKKPSTDYLGYIAESGSWIFHVSEEAKQRWKNYGISMGPGEFTQNSTTAVKSNQNVESTEQESKQSSVKKEASFLI